MAEERTAGHERRALMTALSGVELRLMLLGREAAWKNLAEVRERFGDFIRSDTTTHSANLLEEIAGLIYDAAAPT